MSIFNNIYGHAKTASGETVSLDEISASEFLQALDNGEIEDVGQDLSAYSDEELLQALEQVETEEEYNTKLAGDTNYWETAGRLFARSYIDEMSKVAYSNEESYDLNDLSVEEFINLAAAIESQLE